jgi:squalene cyclase
MTIALVEARAPLDADGVIARARAALLRKQSPDGGFSCDTDIGPVALATQIIVESLFGALPAHDARDAAYRLRGLQLPDGSLPAYPGARRGSLTATALGAAALRISGHESEALLRAQAFVAAHGGDAAVGRAFKTRGDPAALYLLPLGRVAPSFLPPLPPGLALAPVELLLRRHVHAGNVMVVMVIVALAGRYGDARPRGLIAATRTAVEMTRVREYLLDWQNPDGSWNEAILSTTLMLLGLHAVGMTAADPPVKRALAWLQTMKRRGPEGLDVCAVETCVWSTALAALALSSAGAPPEPLQRAQAFLLEAQLHEPMPRANQRKASARRTGGWAFQRGNVTMPDTDDTGVALAAIATLAGERAARDVFRAIDDGIAWVRDMQNPDGGFPTFVWGLPSKKPGPMFLADLPASVEGFSGLLAFARDPPPEAGDPALEGVTGRVLWGLGKAGVMRDDPAVCRAVQFLIAQQCESGAWWGRWKVAYLAETATVLMGLAAVGEDMSASYVARATSFLEACQNADGGFGEVPETYRDPRLAGRGPSMPPVTAYVLLGLLATGRASPSVLEAGARYLVATQNAEGLWDNAGWLHTFIPPEFLYTYDMPAWALPLFALAEMRRGGLL